MPIPFPDLRKQEKQLNGEALLIGLRLLFRDRIKTVRKGFVFRSGPQEFRLHVRGSGSRICINARSSDSQEPFVVCPEFNSGVDRCIDGSLRLMQAIVLLAPFGCSTCPWLESFDVNACLQRASSSRQPLNRQ